MILKGDLINDAYSRMRISGLTVNPSPEDVSIALMRLENMAAEWEERNICISYNFEDYGNADPNTNSNIPRWAAEAVAANLAIRLLPDFGKDITPSLMSMANQSLGFVVARTAKVRQTNYPNRMPLGSGNSRVYRYQRYYKAAEQAPQDCDTIQMVIDQIEDYSFDWTSSLEDGDSVASYTIESTRGVDILADTLAGNVVSFQLKAVSAGYAKVTIKITTTDGKADSVVVAVNVSNERVV